MLRFLPTRMPPIPAGTFVSRSAAALWLALWFCIASPGEVAAQGQSATEGSARRVNGLLVKFKDAPAHEATRRAALSASRDSVAVAAVAAAAAHERRVQQTLAVTGLSGTRLQAFGRAALHLRWDQPLSAAQAEQHAERLRQRPEVEWVVLNERERRLQVPTPNDPMFAASAGNTGQWWLHPVSGANGNVLNARLRGVPGLQTAWLRSTGVGAAAPIAVAVLDTGITVHPDLDANVLPGYDFVSTVEYAGDGNGRDADPADPGDFVSAQDKSANPVAFSSCAIENSSWHGTNIAGVVAAVTNNGDGVAGVNWNARIVPVRVAGKCGAEVADIIDGMYWAAGEQLYDSANRPLPLNAHPARVINISFGGTAACGPAYQTAINDLATRGVVVVAAAGNEHGNPTRPASCNGVIGVAALNRDGFKATYSNFGAALAIATAGGDPVDEGRWGALLGDDGLLTIDNFGITAPAPPSQSYSRIAGTSFAAPIVAGTISLMLGVNPNLTVTQIIDGLKHSARPHVVSGRIGACSAQNPGRCLCTTLTCGAGILDADEALIFAGNPINYRPPNRPLINIDSDDVIAAAALGQDLDANATGGGGSGGGGGASSPAFLFALAFAVALLARRRT
jgi:serine protease